MLKKIATTCLLTLMILGHAAYSSDSKCINLGPKPSFIIKFRHKLAKLSHPQFLKKTELQQLSFQEVSFSSSKPLANGAFVVFLANTARVNAPKPLVAIRPGCYTQKSIQALLAMIKQQPSVESVTPNYLMQLHQKEHLSQTDQALAISAIQWNMLMPPGGIDLPNAWPISSTGNPKIITAVLDTGIFNNDSLNPNVLPGVTFTNSGEYFNGATPSCGPECVGYNHGTFVAGLIASTGNGAYGTVMYGVAPTTKILPINVNSKLAPQFCVPPSSSPCLVVSTADEINALSWLNGTIFPGLPAAPSVSVINQSYGGDNSCQIQAQITNLLNKGITAIASAGNEDSNAANNSPSNCNGVISVAATGPSGERAVYSNWGAAITIAAPGGNDDNSTLPSPFNQVLSTIGNGYNFDEGTSYAAPIVAGVVALLYSIDPTMNASKAISIITNPYTVTPFPGSNSLPPGTVSCLDPVNPAKTCGAGIINAYKAALLTRSIAPIPTLISAVRNPLHKTTAFIYFSQPTPNNLPVTYNLQGVLGAIISLDLANNRFIVSNILNPKAFLANIEVIYQNRPGSIITNSILIPGIL